MLLHLSHLQKDVERLFHLIWGAFFLDQSQYILGQVTRVSIAPEASIKYIYKNDLEVIRTMEFNMPSVNLKKAVCHLQWFESGCQPDLELVGVFDLHGEAKYRQTIAPNCPRLDQTRDRIVQIVNFFPPRRCPSLSRFFDKQRKHNGSKRFPKNATLQKWFASQEVLWRHFYSQVCWCKNSQTYHGGVKQQQ